MRKRSWYVFVLCLLSACAGGTAKPPEHAPLAAAAPAPPKVPDDPMALVPLDALFVASVQLDVIEQAPSFTTWRSWASRYACVANEEIAWLTSHTSRIVAAGRDGDKAAGRDGDKAAGREEDKAAGEQKDQPELLLILQGTYTAQDRENALSLIAQHLPAPRQAVAQQRSERTQGRAAVLSSGVASAAVLDNRLLLVGSDTLLSAALELVEHPPATRYADGQLFQHMSARVNCSTSSVCLVAAPDSRATKLLKRELSSVGMKSVGRAVAGAPTALSVDLSQGLDVRASSELKSADETQSVVKQLNDWIWQLDILARLAGLTDVLDEIKVKADGVNVEVRMALAADVLSKLEKRLSSMLEGSTPNCSAAPSEAASAPTESAPPAANTSVVIEWKP